MIQQITTTTDLISCIGKQYQIIKNLKFRKTLQRRLVVLEYLVVCKLKTDFQAVGRQNCATGPTIQIQSNQDVQITIPHFIDQIKTLMNYLNQVIEINSEGTSNHKYKTLRKTMRRISYFLRLADQIKI